MAPGKGNKRIQHLRALQALKKQRREEAQKNLGGLGDLEIQLPDELLARVDQNEEGAWTPDATEAWHHQSDSDDDEDEEEDCEITDNEEEEEFDASAFETMMANRNKLGAFEHNFSYQRGSEPCPRTLQRHHRQRHELQEAAKSTPSIKSFFPPLPTPARSTGSKSEANLSKEEVHRRECEAAMMALEKKLTAKKTAMNRQTRIRHEAVLAYLGLQQSKQPGETRLGMATTVARCFRKGLYFARRIVFWERQWIESRLIEEGQRGCLAKTRSWFDDEGVQQAVRDWLGSRSNEGQYLPLML